MNVIREFFQQHKWQRRIIVALLAVIAGSLAGIWLVPIYIDWQMINELESNNPAVRRKAMSLAVRRASASENTLRRLKDALNTENDQKFLSVFSVLHRLDKGQVAPCDEIWLDRLLYLQLKEERNSIPLMAYSKPAIDQLDKPAEPLDGSVWTRERLMVRIVGSGRDNKYIRQALQIAATDPAPMVKKIASTLAAKFGEDEILKKFLSDPDLGVQSITALGVGIAKRSKLTEEIEALFFCSLEKYKAVFRDFEKIKKPNWRDERKLELHIDVVASSAFALIELNAADVFSEIFELARQTRDPQLQEKLLIAIQRTQTSDVGEKSLTLARQTVGYILKHSNTAGERWSPVALEVAVAMGMNDIAAEVAMKTLQTVTRKSRSKLTVPSNIAAGALEAGVSMGIVKEDQVWLYQLEFDSQLLYAWRKYNRLQILAALNVAEKLNLPCQSAVLEICRSFDPYSDSKVLTAAVGLLGKQTLRLPEGQQREQNLKILRDISQYTEAPFSALAAAMALWIIEPATTEFLPDDLAGSQDAAEIEGHKTSVFYLREVLSEKRAMPRAYAAWNIVSQHREKAYNLGCTFLPGAAEANREYSKLVRSTGVMLLALSARTAEQKTEAIKRVSRRIKRMAPADREAVQCALLILGQDELLPTVRRMFNTWGSPREKVIIALLRVRDKTVFDLMLWNDNYLLSDLAYLLDYMNLKEILAQTVPDLPTISKVVSGYTQAWQLQVMRLSYGINRDKINFRTEQK